MPNSFAYIALFCWPLVMVCFFALLPRAHAIALSIIGGYLFLPVRAGFDLPILPVVDKTLIPAMFTGILCLVMPDRALRAGSGGAAVLQATRQRPIAEHGTGQRVTIQNRDAQGGQFAEAAGRDRVARAILLSLFVLTLIAPFFTALTNPEPLVFGPRFLPGLRLYDAFSMALAEGIYLLPFLIGWRYMAGPREQHVLTMLLVLSGLVYSLGALFEVRMSPQLNTWIYGFFQHQFSQHMREGGFRPIVFLGHGLALSMYLAVTVFGAVALWRQARAERKGSANWILAAAWMFMTLVLSKSLGALAIAIGFGAVLIAAGKRPITVFAAVIATLVIIYPVLRGSGLSPVQYVYETVNSFNAERAASFKYRLDNEDELLARANLKPLFGWGSWGRNRIFDPVTGDDDSVTDGDWIITIGVTGWLGYLARYGLLAVPLIFLARRRKAGQLTFVTAGLCLILAANLLDAIPNATIVPVTWLIAGSLAGFACREYAARPSPSPAARVPEPAPQSEPAPPEPPPSPAAARAPLRFTRTRG
ncbi:hypothetical protein [Albidovulum sediminis]|uniref:Uncharacterized protein n=1 Tax=Albidovulum sediminis TaxID=3066345 RepID=A0ABT2NMF1_9RHOB|nr:hypothetical protein [Defluviimonas sediminis]MCT8330096.1 hypothetical protein [Defluviimonas sediminis]